MSRSNRSRRKNASRSRQLVNTSDRTGFDDGRKLTFESLEGRQLLSAAPWAAAAQAQAQAWVANHHTAGPATHFGVSERAFVTAGHEVRVTITALDANGRVDRTFNGTADITSSDPLATLPTTATFHHGHARITVTYNTGGSQSITATDSANATILGSATTNVAAAVAPTHFGIFLWHDASQGHKTFAFLVALDANNHVIRDYQGTVNVSTTDPLAVAPASVTFHHGHASLKVTFNTLGSQTINVVDQANATLIGSATTNVTARHWH